ncbi:hypothetical protein [Phreatobacter sp. AB_2022a]|uniref:hypothetical protein n=1 Tax=Phreatobacter sp. AB_2022a TaxID=3003134 RepID=UPI002286DB37|nr:hypothetical protein [Phreatobacter sp. AB_2022a]MCZ0734893.1 hypothetical protein [Phreatobacter sp. AB_2022a]
MFHASDPRASLGTAAGAKPAAKTPVSFAGAEYARFYAGPPQEQGDFGKTWYARAQNFILGHSETNAGAVLERRGQIDEYCLIIPDAATRVQVRTPAETVDIPGYSIVFVPPGDSTVTVVTGGRLCRLFSSRSADLAARAVNAASYAEPHPNIPPFQPWPEPRGGFRVRHYSLEVKGSEGRFGRIFRCTTLMVNFLDPRIGLRDITKLSPHHHDDFEQGSYVIDGAFVHDIRWPWTPDMTIWREDEHELLAAPSLTVIPPPAVHTSRSVLPGFNQMIDIFSPPRVDFSQKPGWVLNADDYPMPGETA